MLLSAVLSAVLSMHSINPKVCVKQGCLTGLLRTNPYKPTVYTDTVFYNIPFAAPPTAAKRFQPPAPAASWSGSRNATVKGEHSFVRSHTDAPSLFAAPCAAARAG